ncbi:MAG: plasmid encoded RepA protein, partial [Bryobacterales bacterium]|nr:plasmid encoded RepA protein [Bryobacterales bacterium]
EARIWYSREAAQTTLPGGFQNEIVLSNEFFDEIMSHPIPTDMEAAKVLSCSPAALDLFMWLSYRCFVAKGRERVPLFGDFGLVSQLGSCEYARPRKFRERLEGWLDVVRAIWPISLHQIEATVSAYLGPGRVAGNCQDSAFSRQVAMYLAKHVGRWSTRRSASSTTVATTQRCFTQLRESSGWGRKDASLDALLELLCGELSAWSTHARLLSAYQRDETVSSTHPCQ